jgi:uncharacterized membrane protein
LAIREPNRVPSGRGLDWAREGLTLLAAAPATWVGITVLFVLMGVVLAIIPFAGMLWSVVIPIHAGGLMIGCRALRQGQPLEIRHLFNGFEAPRLQPLALVGALYLAGSLVVMLPLIAIMVAGTLMSAFALGSSGGSVASMVAVGVVGLIVFLITMAGGLLLSLALWFAPALVVFDHVEALDALKLSLRAGWANVGAFVLYGLAMLGVALVAVSPLIASILLIAARGRQQSGGLAVVLLGGTGLFAFLCILLIMPSAWGAMYASYEDVFGAPA